MRDLTIDELEEELAEELPTRELMGAAGAMPAGHVPVMMWYRPGDHYYWHDAGSQFYRK